MAARVKDRTVVLWLLGAVVLLMLLFTLFGPKSKDENPEPTTYNSGSRGTKVAYLLLGELGYRTERWEDAPGDWSKVDAAGTTLVLAEPQSSSRELEPAQAAVKSFLARGGRVLATGASGARLLPGGETSSPLRLSKDLCTTTPEGPGRLARVGEVKIGVPVRWAAGGPEYRVEQRCGDDAVVVRFAYGKGEAVWWSSALPLTNQTIGEDGDLALVLASVGEPVSGTGARRVLFDEYLHEWHGSLGDLLGGLPWWWLGLQALGVAALLVLSRGRRNGPVRMPVRVPRTSPIEFAESMGRLYGKAGATEAAVGAARGRVVRTLREQCGVPRECIPEGVAEAMGERFGGDWRELERHLVEGGAGLSGKGALELVRALDRDCERIRRSSVAKAGAVKSRERQWSGEREEEKTWTEQTDKSQASGKSTVRGLFLRYLTRRGRRWGV